MGEPNIDNQGNNLEDINKENKKSVIVKYGLAIVGVLIVIVLIVTFGNQAKRVSVQDTGSTEGFINTEMINNGFGGIDATDRKLTLYVDEYIGTFLTHPESGLTLYVRESGECLDDCLSSWIPYLADDDSDALDDLGVVIRSDNNELQFAWKAAPLYMYADDEKLGDVLGDGYELMWTMARP